MAASELAAMDTTLFCLQGQIWIQRQRRRDQPDLFIVWLPNVSQQVETPQQVLDFAAANRTLAADTLADLQAWLQQPLAKEDQQAQSSAAGTMGI